MLKFHHSILQSEFEIRASQAYLGWLGKDICLPIPAAPFCWVDNYQQMKAEAMTGPYRLSF